MPRAPVSTICTPMLQSWRTIPARDPSASGHSRRGNRQLPRRSAHRRTRHLIRQARRHLRHSPVARHERRGAPARMSAITMEPSNRHHDLAVALRMWWRAFLAPIGITPTKIIAADLSPTELPSLIPAVSCSLTRRAPNSSRSSSAGPWSLRLSRLRRRSDASRTRST